MNPNPINENYTDKILSTPETQWASVPQWIIESPEKDLELFNEFHGIQPTLHGIQPTPKATTLEQEAARLNRPSAKQLQQIRAIANLAG